jgi:hypothetical protein
LARTIKGSKYFKVGANMITQAIPTHMTLLWQIVVDGFKSNVSASQDDMVDSNWLKNAMD